jgi:hypothetical protein
MKFFNLRRKISLPSNFKGKLIKYDLKMKSISSNGENLEDNFKNRTLLVIYPYPCKIILIISQRKIEHKTF